MALAAHGTRPPVPSQTEQAANGKQASLGIERRVDELIERIRPNKASDTRRKIVSDYVKSLIRECFSPAEEVEAFMFGSVPLKTYLPDGDIDLAVFQEKGPKLRESWPTDLKNYLESETAKAAPQYRIKDVQIINAEVKLLKCLVDNIVVDISFDTLGGICTVLFLESIDRLIGQEHLFKRSIILVKAWCYYESRLLGAHHSLLSTYALETMVLYIFNMYVEELSSPLKVLQKFLDVFSTFDWDSKALSLQGPIPLSAFGDPERMKAELKGDAMLKERILESMLNMYRPPREQGPVTKAFIRKFNIVDPLLPTNNLGKSINIASKYRIREALLHGSRVLNSIFAQTGQHALEAMDSFFETTWGAQSTPASHPEEVYPLQPLMLPISVTLAPPPQQHLSRQNSHAEAHALAAHAAMGSYTLAAAQNSKPALPQLHTKSALHSRRNSSDDSEGRKLSRTYSGPLPERPRSSASNASTGSDSQPNTPPFGAGMSRRGAAEAWARFHQSRPGSLLGQQSSAADMNGTGTHARHDARLQQGHMEHTASNGGIMTPNGHVMSPSPFMPFHAQGMPYHMAVPASHAELLRYHHMPTAAGHYGFVPPVSMVNGYMYPSQQPVMYPLSFPGPAPAGNHQHQNGMQASHSDPAQEKRSRVSSTAQEAKEDLLAGDLEMLSGHLEKAKRCHKYVTSTDTSTSAPAQQPKSVAAQQARPAPESSGLQTPDPVVAHQRSQPSADLQRSLPSQPPTPQGQSLQQAQPPSQTARQVPSYKAAATKRLPPRSTSIDSADLRRVKPPASGSASPVPSLSRTAAPSPAPAGAMQPWPVSVASALPGAAASHIAAASADKLDRTGAAASSSTALPAPPPPINILRRSEASEDSLSAHLLPPGPPLTPSSAGTVPSSTALERDDVRSLAGSSHGSDMKRLPAVTRSELDSPIAGNSVSAAGPWGQRRLADAVRQRPQALNSSSHSAQEPHPPVVQPIGHYQSAVLGLGRPHPKSPQPAPQPSSPPAKQVASVTAATEQQLPTKGQEQHEGTPGKATQLPRAPAPDQRSAAQVPGVPAAGQLAGAPAVEQKSPKASAPAQTPKAKLPPMQFTLSDGDFPTLRAAPTGRRRGSTGERPSPSSSAAATPTVPEGRLPSFSASSSPGVPRWGPAAKAGQPAAQSAGSSPAPPNRPNKSDAKAATQLLPSVPDRGSVSRSEGSSPTAAGQKGAAWTGQISHAVLTGAVKNPQPVASPSARGVLSRPSSAQASSQSARILQ